MIEKLYAGASMCVIRCLSVQVRGGWCDPDASGMHRLDYPPGVASVSRRGEKWRVLWRLGGTRDGKQQSWAYHSEDKALHAKRIAEAHRHRITAGEVAAAVEGRPWEPNKPIAAQTPTVKEWAATWLDSRTQIGDGTRVDYRRKLDRVILPAIGHLHLHEVEGSHVAAIVTGLQARVAAATVDRHFAVLRSMFLYAVRDRKLDDNPVARIRYQTGKTANADEDEANRTRLAMWELDLIVANAKPADQPLIEFLAATGCRWGEATAVTVGAVDLAAGTVRIYRAWTFDREGGWTIGPTKGRNRRTLPLPAWLIELLRPLVKGRKRDDLLFPAPDGGRLDNGNFIERRWDPAIVAAMRCPIHPPSPRGTRVVRAKGEVRTCGSYGGLNSKGGLCGRRAARGWNRCHSHAGPVPGAVSTCDCRRLTRRPTPHDLRHSHVEWMRVDGIPMSAISRQVGHRTEKVTDVVYSGSDVDPRIAVRYDALRRSVRGEGLAGAPNGGGGGEAE